jgi:hypothetical protein
MVGRVAHAHARLTPPSRMNPEAREARSPLSWGLSRLYELPHALPYMTGRAGS